MTGRPVTWLPFKVFGGLANQGVSCPQTPPFIIIHNTLRYLSRFWCQGRTRYFPPNQARIKTRGQLCRSNLRVLLKLLSAVARMAFESAPNGIIRGLMKNPQASITRITTIVVKRSTIQSERFYPNAS
ncbi:hypothetical protein TcasGA2_TC013374 [Tribolium castaneum]|uniref:Uncharacterized protein n=1 Tax=Tribolium castaneum TaxID=7070 RepID=D6WLX7_TRICA|nr:hypothetical protein TcasGA2_TC013374 [Tribolium castaneum]